MSAQRDKRLQVYGLLDAGTQLSVIAKTVGVNIRTVRRLKKGKEEGKTIERAAGSGGHNKKRTKRFIKRLKSKIEADPTISIRRHANHLSVSDYTIRKAIKEDLGLKSFARVPRHLLTASLKEKRLARCKSIIHFLKSKPATVKIFSDKKIFTVDQVYNRRNDRFIASSTADVKGVFRTKHPAQVMVLGVLGSDGKKMPPYFFKPNEKVNTEVYYKVLRYHVLPWLKANYPKGNYVWTQDGAPAHKSAKVQKFCKRHMADFWEATDWPPGSPDLNPLDFFWWGAIEKKTNATPHRNVSDLKAAIIKEWSTYPAAAIQKACSSFRRRVELVIAAGGGHIE